MTYTVVPGRPASRGVSMLTVSCISQGRMRRSAAAARRTSSSTPPVRASTCGSQGLPHCLAPAMSCPRQASAASAGEQQDFLARGQPQHLDQVPGFLSFQPEVMGPLIGRKIKTVQTHDALDPFAVRARRTALKPSCSETRRP